MPTKLPVLFFSHGSPLQALGGTPVANMWTALAARLPRPRAVLVISAHWETDVPTVGAALKPGTIHDFGGFPESLYRIHYQAPGAPELAEALAARLQAAGLEASLDHKRGLDHGALVPLRHLYPAADLPVFQLSVQSRKDGAHHLAVGRALAPLAEEGVLIVGSGHMTHNLRDLFTNGMAGPPRPYVEPFRTWVLERLTPQRIGELAPWQTEAPHALQAHPTPEHFVPLLVVAGAADTRFELERLYEGFEGPSLAMDCFAFWPA